MGRAWNGFSLSLSTNLQLSPAVLHPVITPLLLLAGQADGARDG